MTQTNDTKGIKLDRSTKILLLNILQQGFITEEQRSEIQKLLKVPLLRLCYADSAEVVNELLGMEKYKSADFTKDLRADCKSMLEAMKMQENEGET